MVEQTTIELLCSMIFFEHLDSSSYMPLAKDPFSHYIAGVGATTVAILSWLTKVTSEDQIPWEESTLQFPSTPVSPVPESKTQAQELFKCDRSDLLLAEKGLEVCTSVPYSGSRACLAMWSSKVIPPISNTDEGKKM